MGDRKSRDLAEFTRDEILEMYPEDVIGIYVPRRDDKSRLTGPLIIELEFDRDTLDPHIVNGRENFQLRMKKERPTIYKRCLQFGHPKKYCRSEKKFCGRCSQQIQEEEEHSCCGLLCYTKRKHQFRIR